MSAPLCDPSTAHWFDPGASVEDQTQAMRLCAQCPLAEACRVEAELTDSWGIWGGQMFIEGRLAHLEPRMDEYTEAQRKEAHRRYANGERAAWIVDANREYHRIWKLRKIERLEGDRVDALMAERFGDLEGAA